MGITVGVLGVLSAGLFVGALVLWSGKQASDKALEELKTTSKEVVTNAASPEARTLISEAGKTNKSLLNYLTDANHELATKVSGNGAQTPKQLMDSIKNALGADGTSLIAELDRARATATAEKRRADDADAARKSAEAKLTEAADRINQMEEASKKTIAALNAEIAASKALAETNRTDVTKAMADIIEHEKNIAREAAAEKANLSSQLAKQVEQNKILEAKNRELTQARGKDQLKPTSEFALVDGSVIATDPGDSRVVYINRGQKHHIVLGMTFEVYNDASEIIADSDTGEYRTGKAAVEVIRLDADSSMCRVTRSRGRVNVGKGDVIVNAIYDPAKRYTFLVIGNFDSHGVGSATPEGAADIKALISAWNGKVSDTIRGDLDFLVLGARPVVPPQPPPNAPIPVVQEYLRLDRQARQYDDIFKQAVETSIPVLNHNRLMTLIGQ